MKDMIVRRIYGNSMLVWIPFLFILLAFRGDEKNDDLNRYAAIAVEIPETVRFAGEEVPLKDFDIRERYDRELLVNTYFQSQTLMYIKRAHRWFPVIEPILKQYGVPDDFKYLALAESGLTNVVSPKGATGFWQFIEKTAREYGLEVNAEVDERYHVEKATSAACRFILESYQLYKNWTLAAASYNVGRPGLNKQLSRQGVNSYYDLLLNEETSRYLFRILAIKAILNDPVAYGYRFDAQDLYPPVPYRTIPVDSSIANLADFAKNHGINYKILKINNPWLRDISLKNTQRKTYQIKIPESGYGQYEFQYELKLDSIQGEEISE